MENCIIPSYGPSRSQSSPALLDHSMASTRILNALFHFAILIESLDLKQCYKATGQLSNDLPCNPFANVSACCGEGSVCISNLFCITPWSSEVPGTCTDPSFSDPACPCPSGMSILSTLARPILTSPHSPLRQPSPQLRRWCNPLPR